MLKQNNFTNYTKRTLQAMFLTKTRVSSECKFFVPSSQNIICFSRTPPIVQPMQKKSLKSPYTLKATIWIPCHFKRAIFTANAC